MGHKGPSFWREQPYIMYMILKAFLTVDFFTPWSIYTTDWPERKTYENEKILEYVLLNLNLSPCADGPKVTVHKDQKSPS